MPHHRIEIPEDRLSVQIDWFVSKTKKQASGCLEWQAHLSDAGYGKQSVLMIDGKWKNIKAHRLSWHLFVGPIPDGLLVLHACDNPRCVRPEHLWLGDHHDNIQDCLRKGRAKRRGGEAHHNSRLTVADVREMRRLDLAKEMGRKAIARQYRMNIQDVRDILNRKTWKSVE